MWFFLYGAHTTRPCEHPCSKCFPNQLRAEKKFLCKLHGLFFLPACVVTFHYMENDIQARMLGTLCFGTRYAVAQLGSWWMFVTVFVEKSRTQEVEG